MFSNVHIANTAVMAEILLSEHLLARFLNRQDRYPLRLALTSLICLLAAFFFPVPSTLAGYVVPFGTFMYLCMFCIAGAGLYFSCRENLWSIFYCAITGYTVHQLASDLHGMGNLLFPSVPDPLTYLLTLAIAVGGCYAFLSPGLKKTRVIQVDNKKMMLLSALVLLVDVMMGLVSMELGVDSLSSAQRLLYSGYNTVSCIFVLWLLMSLLDNRRLETEVAILSQLMEEEKKQYEMSRDNIEIINLKCHDLKHQIRHLRENNAVVSGDALLELEDAVGIYDAVARTGNDALDVILTEKSLICERSGIHLTCIADGERVSFISPADVYSLFGNALDNAIEAVIRIPDPDRRNVSLNVQAMGRLLSIHVENYFLGQLTFEGDLPQTSKADKSAHGFGMKSMRMLAERYGGCLTTGVQGEIFHLDIVIPIPQQTI